jgi:hypothetical protein
MLALYLNAPNSNATTKKGEEKQSKRGQSLINKFS